MVMVYGRNIVKKSFEVSCQLMAKHGENYIWFVPMLLKIDCTLLLVTYLLGET